MSIKEKLESLGKNSIQLKIARKETYKLGATRFGGKPDVPPDFVWPTYEGESYDHVVKDRPLTFLAQFNCEELAQFDKEHLLPDHGLLSFFYETDTQCWGYDPKDQGCARVYWFEDMSALSAADFPADIAEDFKFPMVKIRMESKCSYPSWEDFSEVFPDEKDDSSTLQKRYDAGILISFKYRFSPEIIGCINRLYREWKIDHDFFLSTGKSSCFDGFDSFIQSDHLQPWRTDEYFFLFFVTENTIH